jgi:hypothetical protein
MRNKTFFTPKLVARALILSVIVFTIILECQAVFAQSTILIAPSTDVVPKKKCFLEFHFVSHLDSHDKGGFQTYVPRVGFGLGKGVEVGFNVATADSATSTAVYGQPNIKWQFYSNDNKGVAASVGTIVYIPLKDRKVNEVFELFYSIISKKLKGNHGPRLSIGGYKIGGVNADVDKGGVIVAGEKPFTSKASFVSNKIGIMAGYEQPISTKVTFIMDWFSGKNGFGYLTSGFFFTLPKNGWFRIGYSNGNSGHRNHALFLAYGVTF